MPILIEIPDSVVRALRLPPGKIKHQLKVELAVSLYGQGILTFGKSCELAGMTKVEFGLLLGRRNIPTEYNEEDLKEDIANAGDS